MKIVSLVSFDQVMPLVTQVMYLTYATAQRRSVYSDGSLLRTMGQHAGYCVARQPAIYRASYDG